MDDKVLDKIRKVKALADRAGTEGEAQAALLKMQELLAKHGLSEADVIVEERPTKEVDDREIDVTGNSSYWRNQLAIVIAKNFRCEVYISTRSYPKKQTVIHFLGLREDVELAQQSYVMAQKVMERLKRKYLDRMKVEEPYWYEREKHRMSKSYLGGFIDGLSKAFERQVESMALVITKDKLVVDAVAKMHFGRAVRQDASSYYADGQSRRAGFEQGHAYGKGNAMGD